LPQWTASGVALCTASLDQLTPTLVPDGVGGAIVTWMDMRNAATTEWDIYAQRVSAAGVPQWTTNGVAICTATGLQDHPAIVSDGAGGAIVTWKDSRAFMYARRVNAAGVPQWTPNGVALGPANYLSPTILSDGAGGAIVCWPPPGDLVAQRVNAAGVPQWTANGVALSTANATQGPATSVSDGAGGAIVAWQDSRGHLYAQRIGQDGQAGSLLAVPGDVPSALALARPNPNPAGNGVTLRFSLPRAGSTSLVVWDAAGRQVRTIVGGEQPAGNEAVRWDLRDDGGRAVPPGLYFVRLEFAGRSVVERLVTLR
jgi:hypothetical protein